LALSFTNRIIFTGIPYAFGWTERSISARNPEARVDAVPRTEVRAMKKIDWSYHRKG